MRRLRRIFASLRRISARSGAGRSGRSRLRPAKLADDEIFLMRLVTRL
jgi:hypothetical protein